MHDHAAGNAKPLTVILLGSRPGTAPAHPDEPAQREDEQQHRRSHCPANEHHPICDLIHHAPDKDAAAREKLLAPGRGPGMLTAVTRSGMEQFSHIGRGLIGIAAFIGLAVLCSSNRRAIPWRLVWVGLVLQIAFGCLVLHVTAARLLIDWIGAGFVKILDFNTAGAAFLFGALVTDQHTFGYLFAFNVLPTIIFFSAISSLLFYLGILQKIVYAFAWVLSRTMNLSGAESLSASANIFLGQTEAPLLVKPYLADMTPSELMAVMVGGFATIAGAVMVAYIGMLGGADAASRLVFAKHLLTASVMSAPAGLLTAKILLPQTGTVDRNLDIAKDRIGANALDAIANGTTDGLRLAVNVGAMLLVFTAMIALVNWVLSAGVGGWSGINDWIAQHTGGRYTELSMQYVLGVAFAPLAWLMGVDYGHLMAAGQLIGEKTVLNEFYAYGTLAKMKADGLLSGLRDQIILTYALCGFSNIASIGIQIAGIGTLAPNQRATLARISVKALIGGSIACFLTACVAAMLT
jgi:CNT family concentrative nucleoside transporter